MKRSVACRCLPCRFLRAEERDIHTACNGPFPRRHACSRGVNGCERRQQDLLELELYILGRLSRLTFPLSHFKRRGLQLLQRIREIPANLCILSRGRTISSSLCATRIPYSLIHLATERINLRTKARGTKAHELPATSSEQAQEVITVWLHSLIAFAATRLRRARWRRVQGMTCWIRIWSKKCQ